MIDATKINLYKNDICAFAEDLYYIAPGEPIKLWDYQKEILYKATEKNEDGTYKHKVSIFSMPRQNSKSELSTIIGVHSLFFSGWGHEILSLGIGGKDTARVIFRKARRAIKHSPVLFESISDKNFLKNEITVPALESTWQIAAAEVLSSIGRSFDLVLFDELGLENIGLNTGTELYDSITAGQAAKENSRIIVTSTVKGNIGKLYDLIQLSKKDKNYFCYVTHENNSPLITKEYLKRRKKELHPRVYENLHENRFFSGDDTFITPEIYDACVDETAKPINKMPPDKWSIAWVDLGLRHDSSVVTTVYRDGQNRINIAEIKSWSPRLLKQEIQLKWVEQYLQDIKKRLNVRKIYMDEWQGAAIIQRYGKKLNIEGVHITSSILEQIWTNFIGLAQNQDIKIYDDNSDDIRELRKEALNLRIKSTGANFKVIDVGSIHNDFILTFAGSVWGMVKDYEKEKYNLGFHACYLQRDHKRKGYCPLSNPGNYFFQVACGQCHLFQKGFKVFLEAEHINKTDNGYFHYFPEFEKYIEKIDGFRFSGGIIY